MSVFNILEPKITKVVEGLEGKVILVYGGNNRGKTKQGTRMKKPLVLPFESGLNAISGIPYFPINSWSDFKKVNSGLTNKRTLDQVKEKYQTIIFDEIEASARYCQEYICQKHNAESVKTGNEGFGLWKEYEMEYWREINKLTGAGFTVYFIAHMSKDKDTGKIVPKGDKRALEPIIDLTDITIYLESGGVDDEGRVVKSIGYLADTPQYFARSRFDYIDTVIPEYTAENLEKVLIEAIQKQKETEGAETITFEELKEENSTELDYDELMDQIKEQYIRLQELDKLDEYSDIVEEHLGVGVLVSEVSKKQVQQLDIVLYELKNIE